MRSLAAIGRALIGVAWIGWFGAANAVELRSGDLLVLTDAETVTRYDAESGAEEVVLSDPDLWPVHALVAVSTTEIALLRCCPSGSITTVHLDTGAREVIDLGGFVRNILTLTPDGDFLIVGGVLVPGPFGEPPDEFYQEALIRVDRITGEQTIVSVGGGLFPTSNTTFDSCGDLIVIGGGAYWRVSVATGRQMVIPTDFPAPALRGGVDALPSGEILIASGRADNELPTPVLSMDLSDGSMRIVAVLDVPPFHIDHLLAAGVGEHFFVTSVRPIDGSFYFRPTILRVDLANGYPEVIAEPSRTPMSIAVVPGEPVSERERFWRCRTTRLLGLIEYLRAFPLRPGR